LGGRETDIAMAAFTHDPGEWQRLDWRLLQNSAVSLYFRTDILETDVSWFDAHGYNVLRLHAGAFASSETLLVALADLFCFPDYFGRNLDAFNDCLSDIEIPDVGGVLLVLSSFHVVATALPTVAQALLEICADNSRRFLLTGRRFLVLVQSDDPSIRFEPVGATAVAWNPQEWLNSKRGL
jgi:RNAse (barnase) inhibitor barstar